ncbi:Verru_Chthon cassette protein C [Verrucomicrobium sp. GAS474]|uniref:prepilin-type N-terminal cleavage/methylation domain-containing protein n=1 Tax=Verrucomicrobium sp. GAS474 TaxID=1882831 RepID=UPI00087B3F21|nr:prepilin-type N-terminal cleavage/methylation domain-containing protein [Verrucomicrobium sp. GAS474]SDT88593.1 Verru_Chthon cassette protein C [Verrucomicrobium sp. GAS474]
MNSSAPSRSVSLRRSARRGGFTLVEVLVAITVLTLITTLLTQMMGTAQKVSNVVQQRINNFTKARALLDLLARDLSAGLYRSDLAVYPAGSQTTIAFYTLRPGASSAATRNLALVQYSIDATSTDSILKRSDLSIGWGSQAKDVSFGDATLTNLARVTPSDTASGVVGLQIRFVMADGTTQSTYANTVDNPLRAIGVTLAVVDDESLKRMTPAELLSLRGTLASAAPANYTVKEAWQKSLDGSFDWAAYPASLRNGLQIFERFVYVSPVF